MNKQGVTFSGIPRDSRVRQTQLIVVYRSHQGLKQHPGIWIRNWSAGINVGQTLLTHQTDVTHCMPAVLISVVICRKTQCDYGCYTRLGQQNPSKIAICPDDV